jgi:nitrogen PTS system EIIA component
VQLTIRQAAELLLTTETQVRRWIRDRDLPAVMFNEQYRLNRTDLLVWAQTNRMPVASQLVTADAETASLAAALGRGGIHRDIPGGSRAGVLGALVERLALPAAVDRDLLREMILAREAAGSTAIGHGIAIPHARYPNVAAIPEEVLALGLLAAPVDFGAPDGEPIVAVFLLLAPGVRAHLNLLARLAAALGKELGECLRRRADDAAILAAARAGDAGAAIRSPAG